MLQLPKGVNLSKKSLQQFQTESRQVITEATRGLPLEKYETAHGRFKYAGKKQPTHLHNWEPETPRKSGVAVLRFLTKVPRESRGGKKSTGNVWRLEQPDIHKHGVFDEVGDSANGGPDSPGGIRGLRTALASNVGRLQSGVFKKLVVYTTQDTFDKAAQGIDSLAAVRKQIVVQGDGAPADFVPRDVTKVPVWVTDPEGNPKGYKSGITSVTREGNKLLQLAQTEDGGFAVFTTKGSPGKLYG